MPIQFDSYLREKARNQQSRCQCCEYRGQSRQFRYDGRNYQVCAVCYRFLILICEVEA